MYIIVFCGDVRRREIFSFYYNCLFVSNKTGSIEAINKHCETRREILNPIANNTMITLSEADVQAIQSIIDDSSDDEEFLEEIP